VNAGGDGIDSNGDIQIEGGIVVVDGPTNNRNGALDSGTENGGQLLCNGGTVLAIGASGMAECFDQTSSQSFLELILSDSVPKGTGLEISDSDGNILFSHTAAKKFNSVVFSCAKLKAEETYTIIVNNQPHEVIAGISSGGGSFWGMGGGPKGPGGPGGKH